jgi:hypothetical protein
MKWWAIAVWLSSGAVLLYDGIFDAVTATNHLPYFDIAEAVIGFGLLMLLIRRMHKEL